MLWDLREGLSSEPVSSALNCLGPISQLGYMEFASKKKGSLQYYKCFDWTTLTTRGTCSIYDSNVASTNKIHIRLQISTLVSILLVFSCILSSLMTYFSAASPAPHPYTVTEITNKIQNTICTPCGVTVPATLISAHSLCIPSQVFQYIPAAVMRPRGMCRSRKNEPALV